MRNWLRMIELWCNSITTLFFLFTICCSLIQINRRSLISELVTGPDCRCIFWIPQVFPQIQYAVGQIVDHMGNPAVCRGLGFLCSCKFNYLLEAGNTWKLHQVCQKTSKMDGGILLPDSIDICIAPHTSNCSCDTVLFYIEVDYKVSGDIQ